MVDAVLLFDPSVPVLPAAPARLLVRGVERLGADGLPGSAGASIEVDASGALIATNVHLQRFRWNGQRFTPEISDAQGPWPLDDGPLKRLPLSDGRTLAWTDHALFLQDAVGAWQTLRVDHLLRGEFGDGYPTDDGRVLIAMVDAVLLFDPSVPVLPAAPARLLVRGVERLGADGRIQRLPLNGERQRIGRADQLRLSLATLAYGGASPPEVRVRLDGVQNDWGEWGTALNWTFGQLESGDYTVQAAVRDGLGDERQLSTLKIEVPIAWYATGWTKAVLALLLALLIALIAAQLARMRLARLREINASLGRMIDHRTRELREANERLRHQARCDGLTGLANRRHLDEHLADVWQRCARLESPLSVLMIDVDRFKALNDSLGHLAADRILRRIADLLSQGACALEHEGQVLVARYGGDEFVILLGGVDAPRARALARELSHAAAADAEATTLSIGVASTKPRLNDDPEALLRNADQALYAAKREGRNRVGASGFRDEDPPWIVTTGENFDAIVRASLAAGSAKRG